MGAFLEIERVWRARTAFTFPENKTHTHTHKNNLKTSPINASLNAAPVEIKLENPVEGRLWQGLCSPPPIQKRRPHSIRPRCLSAPQKAHQNSAIYNGCRARLASPSHSPPPHLCSPSFLRHFELLFLPPPPPPISSPLPFPPWPGSHSVSLWPTNAP